jgi:hypothetical protein
MNGITPYRMNQLSKIDADSLEDWSFWHSVKWFFGVRNAHLVALRLHYKFNDNKKAKEEAKKEAKKKAEAIAAKNAYLDFFRNNFKQTVSDVEKYHADTGWELLIRSYYEDECISFMQNLGFLVFREDKVGGFLCRKFKVYLEFPDVLPQGGKFLSKYYSSDDNER